MKHSKLVWIIVFILISGTIVVFAQKNKTKQQNVANKKDASGDVIARIGDKTVTVQDIEQQFARIPPQFISYFNSPERKQRYVQNIIDRSVFSKEAEKEGYLNRKDIQKKLKEYTERLLYAQYLRDKTSNIKVTNEEVRQYYLKHQDEFMKKAQAHAKHILLKTKEQALEVLKKLHNGANWDELAKKYSLDKQSASKGGDLGWFSRGRMVKDFDDAVFSMSPNEIRGPIRTSFGYHIIKLIDKKQAVMQPFDKVERTVRNKLLSLKRKEALNHLRQIFYKKYNVEFHKELISKIKVGSAYNKRTPMPAKQMKLKVLPRKTEKKK